MTACWSELRAELVVPVAAAPIVVGRPLAARQPGAGRNCGAIVIAARLQVTPIMEIRAANL